MISLPSVLLLCATVPLATAAFVLVVEITAAMLNKSRARHVSDDTKRPPVIVLIPAHDESRGILPTLNDVRDQLGPNDRLVVVADNCSDDTAEIAEASGASVIRRDDPEKRGKGYALDFGLRSLQDSDPEIVIVVDADCRLEQGTLSQLAATCSLTGRPVQALYLMGTPKETMIKHEVAEFAWRIKNDLRPRGLLALGLPCQLMGTGMAFPRKLLDAADLASGHLAEDLELGLQLASKGHAPLLCPAALVRSEFPSTDQASRAQRARWEHGHLSILANNVLPCIRAAVRNRNGDLLALSLDAAVPPLVLLGSLILLAFMASAFEWLLGAAIVPLIASGAALAFFVSSLVLAWLSRGRDLLTVATIFAIFPYLTNKVGIYTQAFARNKKWVRTGRDKAD
jgi:cellulose synthase/poly-beta-1,6-N-acetylglucosamine synthase-like glycosyltransferase